MKRRIIKFISFFIFNNSKRKKFRKKFSPPRNEMLINGFYQIKGYNNNIILVIEGKKKLLPKNKIIQGLQIDINGNNNTLIIELPVVMCASAISINSSNCYIKIKKLSEFYNVFMRLHFGYGQNFHCGEHTIFYDTKIIMDGNSHIRIGKECLFAGETSIWGADGHSVVDKTTNKVLNAHYHPLVIGDHSWIGFRCIITKNGNLPSNCIVAAGSVVSKTFTESYTIIAGNPAKIVKKNINWSHISTYKEKQNMDEII